MLRGSVPPSLRSCAIIEAPERERADATQTPLQCDSQQDLLSLARAGRAIGILNTLKTTLKRRIATMHTGSFRPSPMDPGKGQSHAATNRTLAHDAHRKIMAMILDGRLQPGDLLQPAMLGEALSMSLTPIREAIRQVQADGLAEIHGRFMRVRRLSEAEVVEIFFIRLSLEPYFAANARVADKALDAMEARVMALMRQGPSDESDARSVDADFHQMIALSHGNQTAAQVVAKLHRRTAIFDHTQVPARFLTGCAEHLDLIDALRERDAQRVEHAMIHHLEGARDAILRRLRRSHDR
ncbi:GntR family transcriptional regulator [Salipiger sp. 1_MG-2023]|uniref:GntR family transcriptional regulator n=1 Tax=Salipiger sp. 1_MG-2023 TaxID=3062665 RepID=UPI0026E262B5|nr:GntR family transcriptional regulator [Salipiger sp. 1_MG-2023]